jgi:hypothetical protein
LIIASEPNKLSNSSKSQAKKLSFFLAPGANSSGPALTGGQENFVLTKFIVFKVTVSIRWLIRYRGYEGIKFIQMNRYQF